MGFKINKPTNVLALVILLCVLIILFIIPFLTYFGVIPYYDFVDFNQISSLGFLLYLVLFILSPIIWYYLVDEYSVKEMLSAFKLKSEGIDRAVAWGVAVAILMFLVAIFIEFIILLFQPVDEESLTFVIEGMYNLSVVTMVLSALTMIGAEVFFRGFLLNKLDTFAGKNIAILSTSLLYGVLHLSMGNLYPMIIPIFLGLLLGYFVMKTQNLYTALVAQIVYHFIIFTLLVASSVLRVEAFIL